MNKIRLRGTVADIRWHSYPAAALNGYRIGRSERGIVTVTGTVVYRDAFKLAQRPLLFVAPMRIGPPERQRIVEITWPIDSLTLADNGALTATLGAQEGSHAALSIRRPDPRTTIHIVGG